MRNEEYCCQRQFIRSLFDDGVDNDDYDDENGISGHGNRLWNSSICIAQHLLLPELRSSIMNFVGSGASKNGRTTRQRQQLVVWPPTRYIEFGAGAALPSLVLIHEGAGRVVITDKYVNECTLMHYVNRLIIQIST